MHTNACKCIVTLSAVLFAVAFATHAQQPAASKQHAIVSEWNQLGPSIERENGYLDALTKSFQRDPPWRVVDAAAPGRRADLIDKIIAEHEKRIDLLRKIKAEDSR
jgi:hypothetical protein